MTYDSTEVSPSLGHYCDVCGNLTPKDGWYQAPWYSKAVAMHCMMTRADAGCKCCGVILGAVSWARDAFLRVFPKVSPVLVPEVCIWIRPDRPFTVVVHYSAVPWLGIFGLHMTAFELCTPEGFAQFHPRFNYISEIPKYPASLDLEKLVSIVKPWLKQCDRGHIACQQNPLTLPKRLIDITGNLRLIEPEPHVGGGKLVRYATLSHCWGSKEAASSLAKTLSTNIQQHLTAISRDQLPQLFRDAIDVARALECEYIWIDSLCIIQDSQEDWKDQSVLMSEVYSNAYLNIAASALPNSSGTLFQDRVYYFGLKCNSNEDNSSNKNMLPIDTCTLWVPNDRGVQCPVTVRYSMDRAHRHLCGDADYAHGKEEPLLERAWVFQERILSRRTVYISSTEVLWECRSRYFCECGEVNNPIPTEFGNLEWEIGHTGPLDHIYEEAPLYFSPISKKVRFADVCLSKMSTNQALAFWRILVEEYTTLMLTRESDRDIALFGIRQSFMTGRDFTYYAGIWIQDLPQSLLWTEGPVSCLIDKPEKGMNAPSWSWLWRKCRINGQAICLHKVDFGRYDLESFEKDSRVSFHVPDDVYQRCHNQSLIPPTLGHFPLYLTAPFLYGSIERHGGCSENGYFLPLSFPDDGPLTDRIKGYGETLKIQVRLDSGSFWKPEGRKRYCYCVLLGHAARTQLGDQDETHECMLLLEEVGGRLRRWLAPKHKRRYVRTGQVDFKFEPRPNGHEGGAEQDGQDARIKRTNLFDDAQVKEFVIV
ncbi:heterokaryon incompatibility protein-domain-containing protein [Pseudoneurospora amorphoporcata]|uniref:Heterokaryon incompatibility protein-domain-containing protein n=1 Tax=Pseudoneurospora amorphoporcata TaxID=241081 RepID=A0AAN6NSP9_9PEZI|nr:heterokaryon incompatibility protein-domain-containing protein [Pseudoneurospora amorphoporcata]